MGKPAARIGDMTAHGGRITLGCPTVLIGGMPAARLTDMHVCPMVTPGYPPIPHVGGPIILGSAGVLIGGMPAARMGDMATCVGPPDMIAMGCMTVLIGDTMPGVAGPPGSKGINISDYINLKPDRSKLITLDEFKKLPLKIPETKRPTVDKK